MFRELNDRAYLVGGAVRDELMGIKSNDKDYVIQCSQLEFETVFPDAKLVGTSFPVYLHPETGSEIALTRTEKSSGNGYGDFVVTGVGVPIEDDLKRRDFSINSVAKNCATGEYLDPHNGIADITSGILRCINPNAFIEDPVRILRGLRFKTRFDLVFDSATSCDMRDNCFRLKHVTKERIEKEFNKCYHSDNKLSISSFFYNLTAIGAMEVIFPEVHEMQYKFAGPEKYHGQNTILNHVMEVIDKVEESNGDFKCLMGGLFHDLGKINTPENIYIKRQHIGHENRGHDMVKEILKVNRFTSDVNEFVPLVTKLHMKTHSLHEMKPSSLIKFYKQIPKKYYEDFFLVCNADHPLNEEQIKVKNKLDKLRDCVYDTERIKRAYDKKAEADRQLVNFYKTL